MSNEEIQAIIALVGIIPVCWAYMLLLPCCREGKVAAEYSLKEFFFLTLVPFASTLLILQITMVYIFDNTNSKTGLSLLMRELSNRS
jgi:H+/Cl- antiporter ClcA